MTDTTTQQESHSPPRVRRWPTAAVAFILGVALAAAGVWVLMPGMMLNVHPSRLGFDETVEAIEAGIDQQGWVLAGKRDMQKSLSKHGRDFPRRVAIVELCHPEYADRVLTDNRELAAMMPCSIAVYEGDDGAVYVSRMNTGLMGRMFGGTVAEVMGGPVARDEKAILSRVLKAD